MRITQVSRTLVAIGLGGLGVLSLLFRDFAMNWQPVPDGVPWRPVLACASGAILLLGGIGVLINKKTSAWAALVLTIFVLSWLLLLEVPRVVKSPTDEGVWLGFGETSLLVSGLWILHLTLAAQARVGRQKTGFAVNPLSVRAGQILFALSLPVIGLSHFVYLDATVSLVPAWLPFRPGFAYVTGSGHMAAGVGVLLLILPRIAATAEAAMISLFVLLVHIPGVAAAPSSRFQWTMMFIAMAYASAAWAVAGSFQSLPWIWTRWGRRGGPTENRSQN